ncbi:MAG TPA: DUF1937 family protein [Rhizomicrobium sp.]|nr:DUF1937 family protein [Rhizomicrobium sp.]
MTTSRKSDRDIVYLACPYTHPDHRVREARFHAANRAAVQLIKQGRIVYSPITMTHPLDAELAGESTMGSDYWVDFDIAFMEACSEMVVLMIDGWRESSGIKREIEYFERERKPIKYIEP